MSKVFQRFVDIWKMDFLAKFVSGEGKDTKITIYFWFVSNFFLVIVFVCSFCFYSIGFKSAITTWISENVPENAKISVSKGQLSTENIDEPFFREIKAENTENSDYNESVAFLIDTHLQSYDIALLDEYVGAVVILHDRVYIKDDSDIRHILFSDVPDFSLTKQQAFELIKKKYIWVVVFLTFFVFIVLFIVYAGFRLISALWWALMLWICSRMFDLPLTFEISYKAILNFYFIPAIVAFVISMFGVSMSIFVTTLIFLLIFVGNFIWMKRNKIDENNVVVEEKKESNNILEASTKTSDKS
ncbi:MAG: hypothetical protein CR972_05050 [Candidatus Moraniibacteriota bacterium]|nr:MAG: hypothetical protein CR972_05050 [Candidatus Moranbacteria bacterium]